MLWGLAKPFLRTFFCIRYPFPKSLPSGKGLSVALRALDKVVSPSAKLEHSYKLSNFFISLPSSE